MEEDKFKKAFNEGYIIAEHAPTLMESLNKSVEPSNDYLNAIISGGKQYTLDKTQSKEQDKKTQQEISKQPKKKDLDKEHE